MAGRLLRLQVEEVAAERDPTALATPATVDELVLERQHLTDGLASLYTNGFNHLPVVADNNALLRVLFHGNIGMNAYFITDSRYYQDPEPAFSKYFESIEACDTVEIMRGGKVAKLAFIYRLKNMQALPDDPLFFY